MSEPRPAADRPGRRLTSPVAAVLTFLATACVLVLEIAAGRLLAPYVGVSLTTYTGIIGAILAGIALGAWIGGRAADAFGPERLLGPSFVLGGRGGHRLGPDRRRGLAQPTSARASSRS